MKQMLSALAIAMVLLGLVACDENKTEPTNEYPSSWEMPGLIDEVFSNQDSDVIGDFTFAYDSGEPISFYDYTEDKFTFVSFGTPDCGGCAVLNPAMQDAHLEKKNWRIMEIYSTFHTSRTLEDEYIFLKAHIEQEGYTYPYLIPEYSEKYNAIHAHFPGVLGLPANFILDKNHKIIESIFYINTTENLLNKLDSIEAEYK